MAKFNFMNWMRARQRTILWTVIGGFIASMFVGFGLYLRTGHSNVDAVLEVNGVDIPYRTFLSMYNRNVNSLRDQKQEVTPDVMVQVKQRTLQELVQQQVMLTEAQRYGITVSDEQLSAFLAGVPAFQKDGRFDPQAYLQALQFGIHMTPQDFEEAQKKELAAMQVRQLVQEGVKVTDKELELHASLYVSSLDPAKRQEAITQIQSNPEGFRKQLREQKINQTLEQWARQMNTNLQVKSNLEQIEKRR